MRGGTPGNLTLRQSSFSSTLPKHFLGLADRRHLLRRIKCILPSRHLFWHKKFSVCPRHFSDPLRFGSFSQKKSLFRGFFKIRRCFTDFEASLFSKSRNATPSNSKPTVPLRHFLQQREELVCPPETFFISRYTRQCPRHFLAPPVA